jgi:hypothetical protein
MKSSNYYVRFPRSLREAEHRVYTHTEQVMTARRTLRYPVRAEFKLIDYLLRMMGIS